MSTGLAGSGELYDLRGKKPVQLAHKPAAAPYNPNDVIIAGSGLLVADERGVIEYR